MRFALGWVPLAAALLGAALLAGCGGGAAPTEIRVEAAEFSYEPSTITVPANRPARVTVVNTGSLEHTFTVADLGVDQPLPVGETVTIEFTPTKAGAFELVCTVPGHREAGMIGTLMVNP